MNATVVVTRYKEPNDILITALDSLLQQQSITLEVLMLDQFYNQEIEQYCASHSNSTVTLRYITIEPKSLSYAKNYGIAHASYDAVLFLDTDGIAAPDRAYEITKHLEEDETVGIVGTKVLPKRNGKPFFLLKANIFVNDYSMLNIGDDNLIVGKVLGGSSGLSKKKLGDAAHFDENLGRKDGILLGGEETEMMQRVREKGLKVLYVGKTYMLHQVSAERMNYKWIFTRVFYAGVTKVLKGGAPSPHKFQKNMYDFLLLPLYAFFYILGYVYGVFKYKVMA